VKKLLVALILAVILTATLATPAFAGGPPDVAEKGLNRAIKVDGWNGITFGSMMQGLTAPWIYGHPAQGYACGPIFPYVVIIPNLIAN